MKIQTIHIDGFGVWTDKTWGPLSPGVNVFHGPNETGKSTLMAFLRAMLFGFDRRGSARRYEPLMGGAHGGSLDLEVPGRAVRIERKPGRHVRGTLVVQDGDAVGGDELLDALLGGTTRTLYHNVFAFGLEELEQFHTLQDNEVARHITGAGTGIGAIRWTSVQRDLEDRQSALFLPRGQSSSVNVAFKELETVRDDLERTEHQPQEYSAAHEAKARLALEVQELDAVVTELKQRVNAYEKRLKARPLWERRRGIDVRLRDLPPVETFPEGGVERLALLRRQLYSLETELGQVEREIGERRRRRIELAQLSDSEERVRRKQIIEMLRGLAPRFDAARRLREASAERRAATLQERETLESARESLRPPSQSSFTVFLVLIWIGAAGIAWAGHEMVAVTTILVSMIPIFWYRRRNSAFGSVAIQAQACVERLDVSTNELRRMESEVRELESEIRSLTGRPWIDQADIEARVTELDRLVKVAEDMRRLDETIERAEADMARIRRQRDEIRHAIEGLLAEAAALTEVDFLERAETYKQRQQLLLELEKIPGEVPEPGLLFDMGVSVEEACEQARAELAEIERRLIDARHESGRVEERITIMERSEERSRALVRKESILARIDGDAESWAIVTLCRTLLDETRKIYEIERQPEVLRQASFFFEIMTQGRYARVISPLDGNEIQVERADGARLAPQSLSRGTAEQLYLAMRLALVREYARHVDPLPVVFDDVLVNFDPERTRNTIQAVRELSKTHQVLVFTCHPHLVSQFQEIVPGVNLFPLQ
jgi:uncharacterized protein YhaN